MAWPIGKKPDKDTREKIRETRLAQEKAKPREVREAQNRKIGDSVKRTKDAKKDAKDEKPKKR